MFIYFKGNSVHLDYSPLMINISLFTYKCGCIVSLFFMNLLLAKEMMISGQK